MIDSLIRLVRPLRIPKYRILDRLAPRTVLSFEPNPSAFVCLTRLRDENSLRQVQTFAAGLSDAEDECTLYEPELERHNLNSTMVPTLGYTPIKVAVRRLDCVLEEAAVDHVDLLKIDVEGHEPRVLTGAGAWLRDGRIRHVLLEFNDYWLRAANSSPEALWSQLVDAGFEESTGNRNGPEKQDANYLFAHAASRRKPDCLHNASRV